MTPKIGAREFHALGLKLVTADRVVIISDPDLIDSSWKVDQWCRETYGDSFSCGTLDRDQLHWDYIVYTVNNVSYLIFWISPSLDITIFKLTWG